MRILTILAAAACLITWTAAAQEHAVPAATAPAETTLHGFVVDAMCAKGMMKHPETAMKRAAAHTRECALEEECARSGFGIITDGAWYAFDDAGNKLAVDMLRKSTREKGLTIDATGVLSGDQLAVTMLTEGKPIKVKGKKK